MSDSPNLALLLETEEQMEPGTAARLTAALAALSGKESVPPRG